MVPLEPKEMFITSQWRKIDRAAVMPSEQHLCLISIRVCRWCQTCFVSPAVAPACPGGLSWGRCRGGSGGVHNKERQRCPAPGCVPVAVFVPWQGWEMPWALGLWAGLGNTHGLGLWGSLCPGAGQPGAMPGALTVWCLPPASCSAPTWVPIWEDGGSRCPTGLPRAGSDADIKPGG